MNLCRHLMSVDVSDLSSTGEVVIAPSYDVAVYHTG